ncbi:hypothetical protein AYI69_g10915, partial [Smittium culicis]
MDEFRHVKRRRSRKGELANSTTNFRPIIEVHSGGAASNGENRSLNKSYANSYGTPKSTKPTNPTKKTTKKIVKNEKTKKINFTLVKPAENGQFGEVSLKHMVNGGLYTNLKKFCVGGSDRKIGCAWAQFKGDHDEAFKLVTRSLIGDFYCRQDDLRAQTTYFIFDEDAGAKKLLDLALVYNNKRIEFYQT